MIKIEKRLSRSNKYHQIEGELYVIDDEGFLAEEILEETLRKIKKYYSSFVEKMNLRIRDNDNSYCTTKITFGKEHSDSVPSERRYFTKILKIIRREIKQKYKDYL